MWVDGSGILRRWRGGVRGGGPVVVRLLGCRKVLRRGAGRGVVVGSEPVAFEEALGAAAIARSFGPWGGLGSDAVGRIARRATGVVGAAGAQAESLILAQNERWRRA